MAIITTTLISAALGLAGSAIPSIIDIWKSSNDTKNEIALLEARSENAKILSELKVKELDIEADISEFKYLHTSDAALDGGKLVNALRAVVRPIITLTLFIMFCSIKSYAAYYALSVQHLEVINILPLIWDEETQAIFSAVIAFWFGNRGIDKYRKRKAQEKSND